MIVLDTNVVSEFMRERPDRRVVTWARATESTLAVTSITVAEILYGLALLSPGERRNRLVQAAIDFFDEHSELTLDFDVDAAHQYAVIAATRQQAGRPIGVSDGQIAAICRSHAASCATRNVTDFEGAGVQLINPWTHG